MASRKRLTQKELFDYVAEKSGLNRAQVKEFFDELSNLAAAEVKSRGEFVLPGFGKLVRAQRKAREGRNPATGETIKIPEKTTVKFRLIKSVKTAGLGGDPFTDPDAFSPPDLAGDVVTDVD